MIILFEMMLVGGLLAVASNPSPYYAALGLVTSAGCGCLILTIEGVSFLSLVLFLVYLGGMMVVFAYSAALVAEPYPAAWGDVSVIVHLAVYAVLVGVWWVVSGRWGGGGSVCVLGVEVYVDDWSGVSILFSWGGWVFMIVGWGLLLTLFVVLEVVRGHYSGVLRAV